VARISPPVDHPTHAVVIGAGMGGLAAAHALSRHVDRVTLIERDTLPSQPVARSGTPQGRHVHVLQPGGSAALERLLPGFAEELLDRGAIAMAAPREILWLSAAGWMQPYRRSERTLLSASRDLIECVTRELVLDRSPIGLRTGVEVGGLSIENDRVVGVDLRPRGAAPHEPTERLAASLVVDASGRRSRAPDWLAAAGYERPEESHVDANLAYATRTYRRGPDDAAGWQAIFLQAKPPETTRMGVLFPIEGDRWMLTVAGTNGDVPPTDEAGFLAFARGMRSSALVEAVERLEPLSPIVGYRRTENRRRHFETLRRAPDGFVVIGDAACAFNPVYGQGMSAAALTAEVLDRGLRDHVARSGGDLAGVSAGLQRAVAKANAGAWMVATGEDLRWPGTEGGSTSAADRLVRRYLARVVAQATVDPVVAGAFFDVVALLAEPTSLLRPALAARVLTRRVPAPAPTPPAPLPAAAAPARAA
jgi:2-polyprenyl-6-methoxyphenol hydroxylase-like FAD-dependent oxidoreductase